LGKGEHPVRVDSPGVLVKRSVPRGEAEEQKEKKKRREDDIPVKRKTGPQAIKNYSKIEDNRENQNRKANRVDFQGTKI